MGDKATHDDVLDGALNIVKNNATQICVCHTKPTTYAEATATYMLAKKSDLTSASFTGPADDTSGRKLTVNQQAAIVITNSGNAAFIALCDADDRLLEVTTCNLQPLVATQTVTVPAFKINFEDPV